MCSGRQSRPHLFHVVRKVCTKSGHVSTIPPVVKNNSHHGISTIKSDYPKLNVHPILSRVAKRSKPELVGGRISLAGLVLASRSAIS